MKTLSELGDLLDTAPRNAAVRFRVDATQLGDGYHVTELKLAQIKGIDCGGRRNDWPETLMQVLDGQGTAPLTARKLAGILRQSIEAIPGLEAAPLSVECAPGNIGLSRYTIGAADLAAGQVMLSLEAEYALCKPSATGCCAPAKSACCA
ncbi:DUF6428 family protein [Psychromarinibacter sp. S121]|uniref:DUF6428 family protein n=1 Tax=Psychromarinibacter sp. S121 TaxID=3415127 RepID=UPI003C7A21C2